jgi:large subunit ribosomal protein L28
MSGCQLTGKKTMFGNNVSHSERKTRRTFKVNIQKKTFLSDALAANLSFRVCANVIKTIDKFGGIDQFLMATANEGLSQKAKSIKLQIKAKQAV